jgi:hypothetical protein
MMDQIFECLRCGEETLISELPARCAKCGSGTGVVRPAEQPPARPEPEKRRRYEAADAIRAMTRPTLSDTQVLLLLDNCLVKARQCQERELEAETRGEHSRIEYLRKLRAHYLAMQETLQDQIFRKGVTPDELAQRLAHLDRRFESRSEAPAVPAVQPSSLLPK